MLKSKQMTLIALMLALLIVCSQLSIPIGVVPITLQTLSVLVIGLLLPWKEALITTSLYAAMGLIGLPVFAGFSGGIDSFLSPSFGFVLSFMPASAIIAYLARKRPASFSHYLIVSLVGEIIIYSLGLTYMSTILAFHLHKSISFGYVLSIGLIPFIPGDLLKMILATFLANRLRRSNLRLP